MVEELLGIVTIFAHVCAWFVLFEQWITSILHPQIVVHIQITNFFTGLRLTTWEEIVAVYALAIGSQKFIVTFAFPGVLT